jgi:hypothetical protein
MRSTAATSSPTAPSWSPTSFAAPPASSPNSAAVFDVNPDNIRRKRRLLDGICAEAASLLEDKHVPLNSFDAFRKMLPERQVEAAELMVAMNNYTVGYAKTLARLVENPRVVKYLREHHREIALEFIRIVERQATAA